MEHLLPKGPDVQSGPAARLQSKQRATTSRSHKASRGQDSAVMRQHYEALQSDSSYQKVVAQRQKLPAWKARQQVIDLVASHQVTVIAGSTGSGKSTQCPAFLLDHAIKSDIGGQCQILVTQPRRISAIGVAVSSWLLRS